MADISSSMSRSSTSLSMSPHVSGSQGSKHSGSGGSGPVSGSSSGASTVSSTMSTQSPPGQMPPPQFPPPHKSTSVQKGRDDMSPKLPQGIDFFTI